MGRCENNFIPQRGYKITCKSYSMNLHDFIYSTQVASHADRRIKKKYEKKNRIFKINPDLNSIWIHVSFRFEIEAWRLENQEYVITRWHVIVCFSNKFCKFFAELFYVCERKKKRTKLPLFSHLTNQFNDKFDLINWLACTIIGCVAEQSWAERKGG